jgi:hypothetical protein
MDRPRAFSLQGQEGSSVAEAAPAPEKRTRGFVRDNGLTIALAGAVAVSVGLMLLTGWTAFNEDLARHGRPAVGLVAYAGSGDFLSALFENWESEFLQMSVYVGLTVFLFQRGSAESRDPDADPPGTSPLVLRARSRLARIGAWVYSYSLGLVLALLFVLSFAGHLYESARKEAESALEHGAVPPALREHLGSAGFWFESMQNWQSEFLSTAVLVVLSIWLRHHGSPESKEVEAPDSTTGT